jgi:hypothetical protein
MLPARVWDSPRSCCNIQRRAPGRACSVGPRCVIDRTREGALLWIAGIVCMPIRAAVVVSEGSGWFPAE